MSDILDSTGSACGFIHSGEHYAGPIIYGTVLVPVTKESSIERRIFAVISARESPARSKSTHRYPSMRSVGTVDGVQAYETHGASAGAMHWISANGNLQRLLKRLCDSIPQVAEEFFSKYSFDGDKICNPATGEAFSVDDYRTTEFCVFLHELLGAHFLVGEADESEIADVREAITDVQCREAWKLIIERDYLLKQHGFYEATYADERLRLITASMSINCGVKLMSSMLEAATEKTARALTDSRIKKYSSIRSNFGHERSKWESYTKDFITDGVPVILTQAG